jgi:hypothetical protein
MKPKYFLKFLLSRLDIAVALFGVMVGIFLLYLYQISPTMMILIIGIALIIVSPLYLFFRLWKKNYIGIPYEMYRSHNAYFGIRTGKSASIVFWILTAVSFLILLTNPNTRPPAFFIITAICAGLIVVSILSARKKQDSLFDLLKILMLGLQVRLSVYLFYGGSGIDYWIHMGMNEYLIASGDIASLMNKEISYPIMHISTAITQIITNTPIKEASGLAVLLPLVISAVCVYLFARLFFGEKAGLLATLIILVCDYPIMWAVSPQTTSFGMCLFYFCIYLMGRVWKEKGQHVWGILFILFAGTLLFTHAVSSFILFTTLCAFFVSGCIYYFISERKVTPVNDFIYFIAYAVSLILLWTYAAYNSSNFFGQTFASLYLSLISTNTGLLKRADAIAADSGYRESFLSLFFDYGGYLIIIAFCIFAMYLWLHPKNRTKVTFNIISAFLLLQFVTYVFPLFGLRNIMPTRWFAFMYLFFSVMMAVGCLFLAFRWRHFAKVLPCIMVVFALIMMSGSVANLDSPLYSQEYRISTTYTFEEMNAAGTLCPYLTETITADELYGGSLFGVLEAYTKRNTIKYHDTGAEYDNTIVIWRDYMETRPIQITWLPENYYKTITIPMIVERSYKEQLDRTNTIYDIGSVQGYWV